MNHGDSAKHGDPMNHGDSVNTGRSKTSTLGVVTADDADIDLGTDVDLDLDAVVLAGGRGRRLGGIDKAAIELRGRRLVDRAVDAARDAGAARIFVVGPEHTASPGVHTVREDPPYGGPLAALAAALPLLQSEWVLLLACDLEHPDRICVMLSSEDRTEGATDGIVLRDSGGRAQWLAGLYRTEALRRGIEAEHVVTANAPLRLVLAELLIRWVDVPDDDALNDIDDRADLLRATQAQSGSTVDTTNPTPKEIGTEPGTETGEEP